MIQLLGKICREKILNISGLLTLLIVFVWLQQLHAEGILYSYPTNQKHHPLFQDAQYSSYLIEKHPKFFNISSNLFSDTAIIDFEKRQITFKIYDSFSGTPIWEFHYAEFDEYLNSLYRNSLSSSWHDYGKEDTDKDKNDNKLPSLEFTMPDFYPAWARRILGKEPPKLSIKGFQSLTFGFKSRKVEIGEGNDDEGESKGKPDFEFDYDNMFTIRGSIGRLISIELITGKNKEGSNSNFKEQLDKLKIEYKADPDSANQLEDEIIQEVVAGKTNFQMPGQGLAGFSGSNEGLFGIKIQSQFGPLALTTILSREQSETQKQELDPSGQSGKYIIKEQNYIRNAYFFLDSIYLNAYIGKTQNTTLPEVTELGVFKRIFANQYDKNNPQDYVKAKYGDATEYIYFKILKEYEDYELNKEKGWIRFLLNKPTNEDLIGIYLRTTDVGQGKIEKGLESSSSNLVYDNLWVLKNDFPNNIEPNDSTYYLMWRNVYGLPGDAKPDDFEIEVKRVVGATGTGDIYKTTDTLFSFILGLTDEKGQPYKGDESKFDFGEKYLIFPPYSYKDSLGIEHFSNLPFANPKLGTMSNGDNNMNPNIYLDTISTQHSKYEIVTTGTSRLTTFNIGFSIINGTEKLTDDDGARLERDKDYYIEYEIGQITLISPKAKAASKIIVEYQQESFWQFDNRTFLGAYGKLDFPNIGRDSYFATTVMGQFTASKDKIPRVGNEPFDRFLFDSNLHFDFEPEWMTKLINFIPLISTTSTSSATFDFEIAYSYLSPDKKQKGEAYIDNFQSAERGHSLALTHELNFKASPSAELIENDTIFAYNPPSWKSYWYSPLKGDGRTRRTQIWELDKSTKDPEEYLTTLRLINQPLPTDQTLLAGVKDKSGSVLVNPWCGFMTSIPASFQDRKKDKYFEFWIKNSQNNNNPNNKRNVGVLYIDFGDISEDISINGYLPNLSSNIENPKGTSGEVDHKLDIGLDNLEDKDEVYLYPVINKGEIKFDSLRYGDSRLGEFSSDPSRDNWASYEEKKYHNRSKVNGTQKDKKNTSEDINGDGFKKANHYFRVKLDFSTIDTSSLLDTAKRTDSAKVYGWYPIRIPINNPDEATYLHSKTGSPKWNRIKNIRFIWTDFQKKEYMTQESRLEFTDIKFSRNQWQQASNNDSSDISIISTVLNTVDNKGYFFRPYGIDSTDKENNIKKDYALRLEYENVLAGDEALVNKDIPSFQKLDLSSYKEIHMYIKDTLSAIYASEQKDVNIINSVNLINKEKDLIHFVFRFGNNDSSYYEYRTPRIKDRWKINNHIAIDLQKLSEMKQAYHDKYGFQLDSINVTDTLEDQSTLKIYSPTGVLPVFSDIRWFALGVARNKNAQYIADGEIWVHGLRVKGINPIDGWAFRANLNTNWADFMNLSANFSYDDAEFRQMSEEPFIAKDAKMQAGISAQWSINKFLPEKWGISIPLGTGISASVSRPKRKPGSDIFLSQKDNKADRFSDMAQDFADLIFNSSLSKNKTEAEHYEKNNVNKSWYTSYSKTTNSDNPITGFTLDRITSDYTYQRDSLTELEGQIPIEDKAKIKRKNIGEDHINITTTRTHTASLKYDLSPRNPPKWTSWTPFNKVKSKKFPSYIKSYKLGLLPSRINFDLISGTYIKRYTYRSLKDVELLVSNERTVENLNVLHGFQISYSPIEPLITTDYDITLNRNFDAALTNWGYHNGTSFTDFISKKIFKLDPLWDKYSITYAENSRSQNASIRIDPQFFDWLTHTGDYRVGYQQNPRTLNNTEGYITTGVNSSFGFTSNFRIRSLMSTISEGTEKLKGLSNIFGAMEKGLDKISLSAFNLTYNASLDLKNDYFNRDYFTDSDIYGWDFFKYQIGLKNRNLWDIITGDMNDNAFGGVRSRLHLGSSIYSNDKRSTNQDFTVSTSMQLPQPIEINFNPISLGWKRNYIRLHDEAHLDSTFTFPDFRIGANSNILMKIPFIKKYMEKLGLNSAYNISKEDKMSFTNRTDLDTIHDITISHGWDPLINIDGLIKKWPIYFDYTYSYLSNKKKRKVDSTGNSKTKAEEINSTYDHKHIWTAKYNIPGKSDREIKIFNRWTIPIKGDLNFSLNINYNALRTDYGDKEQDDGTDDNTRDWNFLIHPRITYNFTDYLDGLLEYLFEKNYQANTDTKRRNHTLSLTVTLYLK